MNGPAAAKWRLTRHPFQRQGHRLIHGHCLTGGPGFGEGIRTKTGPQAGQRLPDIGAGYRPNGTAYRLAQAVCGSEQHGASFQLIQGQTDLGDPL